MDPKAVQAHQAFIAAIHALNVQYITLMQRMGVKQLTLYRV